jgi:hypothetical protein
MKRHITALALGAALLLQGCASREGFEARMHQYVGKPEAEVIAALGVPVRSFQVGNRSFVQYERRLVTARCPAWLGLGRRRQRPDLAMRHDIRDRGRARRQLHQPRQRLHRHAAAVGHRAREQKRRARQDVRKASGCSAWRERLRPTCAGA